MKIKRFLYIIKRKIIAAKARKNSSVLASKIAVIELDSQEKIEKIKEILSNYYVVNSLWMIRKEEYKNIEIYIGNPPKANLYQMSNLKWLQLPSAGLNGYDQMDLYNKIPIITNARGIFSIPIAEFVIGTMIMMGKYSINSKIKNIKSFDDKEMSKCNILIVGIGDIGEHIALKGKNIFNKIIGVNRTGYKSESYCDKIYPISLLHELVADADYVISCLPENESTNNIFDRKIFNQMRRGAIFINIGRGNCVDQGALYKALKQKQVSGAVLDATTPDPLPIYHKFRREKRILLTGHLSFYSLHNEERFYELVKSNVRMFVNGKNELINKIEI